MPIPPAIVARRQPGRRGRRCRFPAAFLLGLAVAVGRGDETPRVDAAARIGVEAAGIVGAPAEVVDADGSRRVVAELSGIAWLGGDAYAAVMDGRDRVLLLTVVPADDGEPPTVTFDRTIALDGDRDWEDLAILAAPGGRRRWFFVEEDTPAVREFAEGGDAGPAVAAPRPPLTAVGMVSLAEPFRSVRPNRGPESVAVEPDGSWLWTANEEALERDGPAVAAGVAGRVRLIALPIAPATALGTGVLAGRREVIYEVDPPHDRVPLPGGPLYSGVVALVALGEGRLLVLERSAAAGVPPLENRLYLVDTSTAVDARGIDGNLAAVEPVAKTLLWKGALGVNLEGLCAGPRMGDGRLTLVAVADNAADDPRARRPNPIACFVLTIP